jgi:ribose transport system permease protein
MTTTSPQGTIKDHTPGTERPPSRLSRLLSWALSHALLVILLLFVIVFAVANPTFGSLSNAKVILLAASAVSLLAIGQTLVILTGGIDLSVGSTVGLAGVVAARVIHGSSGAGGTWTGLIVGVLAGGAVGALNGALISVARIPPFIATLGTLTAALGLAQVLSNGSPISDLPSGFIDLNSNKLFGIGLPIIIAVVVILVVWFLMSRSRSGMHVYAVGGNPFAARIAGVKVPRVTFSVYLIDGLLAGLAGVLLAAQATAGIAVTGSGYELDAIAAAVIGGVSLAGGRGTIPGTVIGVLLIATLNNGLDILNTSPFYQQIVKGVLIVGAVFVDVISSQHRPETT